MKLRRKTPLPRIPAPTYNVRRSRQRDYGAGCRRLLVGMILAAFATVVFVSLYEADRRWRAGEISTPTVQVALGATSTPAPTFTPVPPTNTPSPTATARPTSPTPPTSSSPTAVALAPVALPAAPDVLREYLQSVPVLPTLNGHVRDIFRRGQELGNLPRVFAKIGDCNSDSRAFLAPLDLGRYDLGPYGDLQAAVDFYAGSFRVDSMADGVGFNAYSVLDWGFADPQYCQEGESPVTCEFRRHRPSVAIIMFGANDVRYLTTEQYVEALAQIIDRALDQGIIPVLNTFTWCAGNMLEDRALELNAVTVNLAQEYDIPLINFWRAAQDLPACGLVTETHLTSAGPAGGAPVVSFADGEERQAGYALRNLLTLQALDDLRRTVLEQR